LDQTTDGDWARMAGESRQNKTTRNTVVVGLRSNLLVSNGL
jgi:hypothetical protein